MSDQSDSVNKIDRSESASKGTFNPIVKARARMSGRAPSTPPPTNAALAALVHQTDRDGKQQAEVPAAPNSPHAIRGHTRYRGSEHDDHDRAGHDQDRQSDDFGIMSSLCCCFKFGNEPVSSGNYPSNEIVQQYPQHHVAPRKLLLGPQHPDDRGQMCLVLDLDETLVHSSFKPTENPDYIIPVEIEGTVHKVYVCKRPGVDEFMRRMGEIFEIVVYTASLSKYADPLLDQLDIHNVIRHRLFREHCVNHEGSYVKDLSLLDREISQTIIVDNSPLSYMFHPANAIGCTTFIDDVENDRELDSIGRFMISILNAADVRDELCKWPACDHNYYYRHHSVQYDSTC